MDLLSQVRQLEALAKAHLQEKHEVMRERAKLSEQMEKFGCSTAFDFTVDGEVK